MHDAAVIGAVVVVFFVVLVVLFVLDIRPVG
jgi:cytochrome c1